MTTVAPAPKIVQVTIVSYRTADFVKASLHTLVLEKERHRDAGIEISCFIIDNSGEDYESIRAELAKQGWENWVTLVRSERNGGFAYGNNRGFEFGFSQQVPPDYFYLLNPDAEIRPGAIVELVNFMEAHPDAGTAASGIEDERGELWPYAFRFHNLVDEFLRGVRFGPASRLLGRFAVARKMSGEAEQVDWTPGAALICRASVIKLLGGMDEAYFLYFEETDFCLKLVRNGWTNWYVPASRVIHATGQSTGINSMGGETRRLPGYWFESRRRFFIKNRGIPYAVATDLVALSSHALGNAMLLLRGRGDMIREGFLFDLARGSSLAPGGRGISPKAERLDS